jgi:hypothetical protein
MPLTAAATAPAVVVTGAFRVGNDALIGLLDAQNCAHSGHRSP